MDLAMLSEMAIGGAGRVAVAGGIRALLRQMTDVVDLAVTDTCGQFEDFVIEPSLKNWIVSVEFEEIFDRLKRGEHDFSDEVVDSFIEVGGFFLPDEVELRNTADRIVSTFLSDLFKRLLLSDQGIPTLANQGKQLHSDTRSIVKKHVDDQLKQFKIELLTELRQSTTVVSDEVSETPSLSNPEHNNLAVALDSARDLISAGKVVSAQTLLEMLLHNAEGIPSELEFRLFTNLAVCAVETNTLEAALDYLEKAYQLQPESPTAISNASVAARLSNDSCRAIKLANQALELRPTDSNAGCALIEALWDADEIRQLDEFVSTEDWVTDDRQCSTVLARIWTEQQRFDDALALSRRLVQDDEADYDARLVLAGCLMNVSDATPGGDTLALCREAVEQATRAFALLEDTELQDRRLLALSIRAGARLSLGELDEAIDDVDTVLQIDPNDTNALYRKGVILLKIERPEEAIVTFDRIKEPHVRSKILFQLALAHRESGDEEAAVNLLQSEVSLDHPTWDDILKAERNCSGTPVLLA